MKVTIYLHASSVLSPEDQPHSGLTVARRRII